jgi:hypothetical protein
MTASWQNRPAPLGLDLTHRPASAKTPYSSRSLVPLVTYSLLPAAYQRVRTLGGTSLAPALARLAEAPSLLSRYAEQDSSGSLGVPLHVVRCPIRLRVLGSSPKTGLGTLRQSPQLTERGIPAHLRRASRSATDCSVGLVLLLSLRFRASPRDGVGESQVPELPLPVCKSP